MGISANYISKIQEFLQISRLLKECNKDCVIIWGGYVPTLEQRVFGQNNFLLNFPGVDMLVRGEADHSFPEFWPPHQSSWPQPYPLEFDPDYPFP